LGKESFDIKLRAWFLVAKSLDIDRSALRLGYRDIRVIGDFATDHLFAFGPGYIEEFAIFKRCNNGGVRVESPHPSKGVDLLNRDRLILGTLGCVHHEVVSW
jgi:hypothetical protein